MTYVVGPQCDLGNQQLYFLDSVCIRSQSRSLVALQPTYVDRGFGLPGLKGAIGCVNPCIY